MARLLLVAAAALGLLAYLSEIDSQQRDLLAIGSIVCMALFVVLIIAYLLGYNVSLTLWPRS
jgi:hypothetical protein